MSEQKTVERAFSAFHGWVFVFFFLVLLVANVFLFWQAAATEDPWFGVAGGFLVVVNIIFLAGFFIVNPNESRVLVLFGKYRGHGPAERVFLDQSVHHEAPRESARPQPEHRHPSR